MVSAATEPPSAAENEYDGAALIGLTRSCTQAGFKWTQMSATLQRSTLGAELKMESVSVGREVM